MRVRRVIFAIVGIALLVSIITPAAVSADTEDNLEKASKKMLKDATKIEEIIVPGVPPGKRISEEPVSSIEIKQADAVLSDVPAFDWCYGCSATSAAMMFGYYDRTGYSNMYAGPTNGGVCPLDNSDWDYNECPLSATHQGYDDLAVKGHVDDYWDDYGSTVDPYDGNWAEHGYADCTADFMGTNQYVNWQNSDGSTRFYYYTNGAPLYDYSGCEPGGKRDGCHGIRLFVESRGYNVVQNYNQRIDAQVPTGGFTFDNFKAEIDAGRPVIIHVTNHSMLGYGYTDPDTIYIHDTWSHTDHFMTWGGIYSGLEHYAVTVIEMPYRCGNMNVNPTSWSPTLNCCESDNEVVSVSASGGTVKGVTVSKVSGPTWLSVSPTNLGDIASGSSKTFTIIAAPPSETSGDFAYTVRVSNICGTPPARDVTGTIHVDCCGNMGVNPTSWSPTLNCSESDNEIVTVSGTGGTIKGVTVSKVSGPTWLSLSPTNLGAIPSGSSKTFTMTASPPSETSGDFTYTVRVSNTCGTPSTRDVTGTITVYCPELSYSPTSYDFGDKCEGVTDSTTFELWNSGTGTLTYSLSETCGWVEVNPTSGSSTGEHNTITVDIDTTGLFEGLHTCDITINSNDGTGTFTVRVNIVPKPDLVITEKWLCWPDNCTICYNVTNTGDGTAPACHNTTLYVDGVAVAHDPVPVDLAPGETYTGCFNGYVWTYTPPSDNITVCADNNEALDELDEDNNGLTNIWMCGDVNGDEVVDMSDVIDLLYYVGYPGQYTICNEWAADVNCDEAIDMSDVIDLLYYVGYPGQYELKCCCL